MESKDTMMNDITKRQFRIIGAEIRQDCSYWDVDNMLLTQAEISFKAGIREMVEWVNLYKFIASPWNYYEFSDKEWQNKLKEWKLFKEVHAACGED